MSIRITSAVKIILILCFSFFIIQQTGDQFFGTHLLEIFGLIPQAVIHHHWYWQVVTYAFLHGDVMHLFFNMLLLVFIGSELELVWGSKQFLKFYLFCTISSGLVYLTLQAVFLKGYGMNSPLIGASGGIYGLLMAFGLLFGERIMLFMMLFPIKAKHFVVILGIFELMTSFYSSGRGVGSMAHLAGMGAGFTYLWARARMIVWKKQARKPSFFEKWQKKRRSKHLKLVVSRSNKSPPDDESKGSPPRIWH